MPAPGSLCQGAQQPLQDRPSWWEACSRMMRTLDATDICDRLIKTWCLPVFCSLDASKPSQLLHVGDLCSLPAIKYMVALLVPKHKSSLNCALQWLSQPAFPSSPPNAFLSSLAMPLILSTGKTRIAFAPVFLAS